MNVSLNWLATHLDLSGKSIKEIDDLFTFAGVEVEGIVSKGIYVIQWSKIATIAASWIISPLLSGLVSVSMFLLIKRFILMAKSPLKAGLAFLPIIYTVTVFINVGGAVQSAPPLLQLDKVPWWGQAIIIFGISLSVFLGVQFLLVPYLRKKYCKFILLH